MQDLILNTFNDNVIRIELKGYFVRRHLMSGNKREVKRDFGTTVDIDLIDFGITSSLTLA